MAGFDDPDPEEKSYVVYGLRPSPEIRQKMREGQARWRASLPPDPRIEKVNRLWEQGKSIKQIMRSVRICTTTAYKYLHLTGAKGVRNFAFFTPEEDDIILTSRDAGVLCKSIADALGRSTNSVAGRCFVLRKRGVKVAFKKHRYRSTIQPDRKKRK